MRGQIWKHNGNLVFCPFLQVDFLLGIPNPDWIDENAGHITNLDEFSSLKEGDVVDVTPIYKVGYPDEPELNSEGLWFNAKIIKIIKI